MRSTRYFPSWLEQLAIEKGSWVSDRRRYCIQQAPGSLPAIFRFEKLSSAGKDHRRVAACQEYTTVGNRRKFHVVIFIDSLSCPTSFRSRRKFHAVVFIDFVLPWFPKQGVLVKGPQRWFQSCNRTWYRTIVCLQHIQQYWLFDVERQLRVVGMGRKPCVVGLLHPMHTTMYRKIKIYLFPHLEMFAHVYLEVSPSEFHWGLLPASVWWRPRE